MRYNSRIFGGWRIKVLAAAIVASGMLRPAYCETHKPVLFLQHRPSEGGTLTPGAGVHNFELGADVTITAVPKAGYQFVYWLGDVSDPTASTTIVHLDAPKIVIAIFERVEYEFLTATEMTQSAPVGGMISSAGVYSRAGFGGPGGRRRGKIVMAGPAPPVEAKDFPVPTPEPTTAALLVMGSLFVFRRRRPRRRQG
ncbi:MAG: InlB B-repeat-containing protein [Planctomycetota bacterium]|jgi:hypothetical protein